MLILAKSKKKNFFHVNFGIINQKEEVVVAVKVKLGTPDYYHVNLTLFRDLFSPRNSAFKKYLELKHPKIHQVMIEIKRLIFR